MKRILLFGSHSNRTPLAYNAYQKLFSGRFQLVTSAKEADFIVCGFYKDLKDNRSEWLGLIEQNSKLITVIISEEPLWDVLWTEGFPKRILTSGQSNDPPIYHLNHTNSRIFDYQNFPYFLTTDDSFFQIYQYAFKSCQTKTESQILKNFERRPLNTAFFLEYRNNKEFERVCGDTRCIAAFRTRLAEIFAKRDNSVVQGYGWPGGKRRQALFSWHQQKISGLRNKVKFMCAIENTFEENYITEKLFDAFAIGSIPIYYIGEYQRWRLRLPPRSFVALSNESVTQSVEAIDNFVVDREFAVNYIESLNVLSDLFTEFDLLDQERIRVLEEIDKELGLIS